MSKTDTAILQKTLKEVQDLTRRVNDIDNELDVDRHGIQENNVKLTTVLEEIAQLRKSVNMMSEKVKNKVADIVEPIVESSDRLTTEINDKKMVVLKADTKPWWQKILRG